ncbi:hypothetical protein MMC07_002471 [Pseudocyphellaria aurata]|nr:hypothetical protein [Pseudocyphellaria aurata]
MCQQHYTRCKNLSCNGVAQVLYIVPCNLIPNCETQLVREPRRRDAPVQFCPDCAKLTKSERAYERKKISDRALREKRAAEGLPPPKRIGPSQAKSSAAGSARIGKSQAESSAAGSARIGKSQAESSAAGANTLVDPSSETAHASGSQDGADPQLRSPQLESSDAPASGSMPGSENLLPYQFQEEIDESLYVGTPEYRHPTPPQPEFPSFHAPVPQQETQFGNVPELPNDPILPFLGILRANGIDLDDRQVAEQLLRDLGLWPAISSEPSNTVRAGFSFPSSQIPPPQTQVSPNPYSLEEGEANLADFFPPRHTLICPPALPLPTRPENQTMPSLDTYGSPRDHSTPRPALPSDFTPLPHAEGNSSAAEEQQDAQELLEMADWAHAALEDLDHVG